MERKDKKNAGGRGNSKRSASAASSAKSGRRPQGRTSSVAAKNQNNKGKKTGKAAKTAKSAARTAGAVKKAAGAVKTAAGSVRKPPLKVIPLGGLHEIGKNMTVLEYGDEMIIIDCGMSFPDDEMLGIDVVIPDFSYVLNTDKKIRGVIITHGHEDHIGGVPYLLNKKNIPVYGTPLPLGLIRYKLEEHGITGDLREIHAGDKFRLGEFTINAIRTTHSIADSICLYIETPVGNVFHTGDFKIDFTPVDGDPIDLGRFAEVGREGVLLLMADSTNAARPGFTQSERLVGNTLDEIIGDSDSRIIIATFSSNVHRIQKIMDIAVKCRRKVAISGRSMEKVVSLALKLGYIKVPKNVLVDIQDVKDVNPKKLIIITTGSQGEPMSALSRMAQGTHRQIRIEPGDQIILSSTPIPGNEKLVSNVVNSLGELGAEVIYSDIADTHVSGHACAEELKLVHSLIRPKFFMPVHGEFSHLTAHEKIAEDLGMAPKDIFKLSNGDCLSLTARKAERIRDYAPADGVLVDGLGVGDVGSVVLRDRKMLSQSGLIVVVASLDRETRSVVAGPDLVSRGFVYVRENEDLIEAATKVAEESLARFEGRQADWNTIRNQVREDLRKFIYTRTERSPVILPIFMEV